MGPNHFMTGLLVSTGEVLNGPKKKVSLLSSYGGHGLEEMDVYFLNPVPKPMGAADAPIQVGVVGAGFDQGFFATHDKDDLGHPLGDEVSDQVGPQSHGKGNNGEVFGVQLE
jgi:hypothetical protein